MTEQIKQSIGKLKPIFYVGFSAVVFFVVTVFIYSTLIIFEQLESVKKQTLINQVEIHFNNERLDAMLKIDSVKIDMLKDNNKLLKELINEK